MWLKLCRWRLTRVVKEGVHKGAVFEEGYYGGDIFEVAVDERRVDECDRLELHTDEPERRRRDGGGRRTLIYVKRMIRMNH